MLDEGGLVCVRYNYWFAILTLLFIYLPSVNVIATLYGPRRAGEVGYRLGIVVTILGGILAAIGYFVPSPGAAIAGWFMIFIGAGVFVMGVVNFVSVRSGIIHQRLPHYLLFIPLLIRSPIIFIIIKLLAIMKSNNNQFIQCQSIYGSRGEAILEAAPQLCLQLYIVLLSMSATQNQWFSIITSAATISLPIIENYVLARGGDFGVKAIIKNILVFLPACLFKVLSVSLLAVFFRAWVILVIFATIFLVFVTLWNLHRCYDFPSEDDGNQQGWECVFLSWLTLAGLGKSKVDAVYRLVSTLLVTITYSIILGIILAICNDDPASGYIHGYGLSWSDLELVKDTQYMNKILGSTISLGWISLIVDFVVAFIKSMFAEGEGGFWDLAVLLEGLGSSLTSPGLTFNYTPHTIFSEPTPENLSSNSNFADLNIDGNVTIPSEASRTDVGSSTSAIKTADVGTDVGNDVGTGDRKLALHSSDNRDPITSRTKNNYSSTPVKTHRRNRGKNSRERDQTERHIRRKQWK